jgi:hypothetical protein
MVTGKADSFDVLEGMSPVRAMANGRTPPETASGACAQRGSLGAREDRQLLVRETETRRSVYKKAWCKGEVSRPFARDELRGD